VPHLGGTLPFLFARIDSSWNIQGDTSAAGPRAGLGAQLRHLWYDTVNSFPDSLRCACTAYGTDRLLLGTDFPYLYGDRLRRCVTYVEDAGLSANETAAILGGTAQTLLGLQEVRA